MTDREKTIEALRRVLRGTVIEDWIDRACRGDNLAVALCSYFSDHVDCPEDQSDDETGWKPWASDKEEEAATNLAEAVLDAVRNGEVPGVGADEGWIATDEKSPANLADVLVTSRECGVRVAWRTESGTWWKGDKRIDKPSHWRALPKGPLL
jgi:hypothetical protein